MMKTRSANHVSAGLYVYLVCVAGLLRPSYSDSSVDNRSEKLMIYRGVISVIYIQRYSSNDSKKSLKIKKC